MHTIRINNPEIEQYIKSVYGDNDSLYDYKASKFIPKDKAHFLWDYIEKHFNEIFPEDKK